MPQINGSRKYSSGSDEGMARWGRVTFDGDRGRSELGPSDSPVLAGEASSHSRVLLDRSRGGLFRSWGYGEIPSPWAGGRPSDFADPSLSAFEKFQKMVYDFAYPVLSRFEWGARLARRLQPSLGRPFRITLHHTAGDETDSLNATIREVRAIQKYHQDGPRRHWADIGYHFLIDGDGRVIEGRPVEALGAHAENHNRGNIGVALMGNFNEDRPSAAQIESLKRLVSYLCARYRIDPATGLCMHMDLKGTACPGRHVAHMFPSLRSEISQRAASAVRMADSSRPQASGA
jgi:N-acetylmuramoyl-L-alanine amidase